MRFLNSKAALWLTALLLVQGVLYYATAARPELTPQVAPLNTFPRELAGWQTVADIPIEAEVQDVLKADDTLNRVYVNASQTAPVYFFIAFFKTQRTGSAPHSPKNCLPGSGWEPFEAPTTIPINVTGRPEPIIANKYVVARGDQRSVTLYWYQSHDRIIASEFEAKFWLIADAIRYRRSDTALVKVVIPVSGANVDQAVDSGVEFVRAAYPLIARQLPL